MSSKTYKCSKCGKLLEVIPTAEGSRVIFIIRFHNCNDFENEVKIIQPKKVEIIEEEKVIESPKPTYEEEINSYLEQLTKKQKPAVEEPSEVKTFNQSKLQKLRQTTIVPEGILQNLKGGF